jgi:hypothetical protein
MGFMLCSRIALKQVLKKQGVKVWMGFIWLGIGTSDFPYEDKSEIFVSFQGRESFVQVMTVTFAQFLTISVCGMR